MNESTSCRTQLKNFAKIATNCDGSIVRNILYIPFFKTGHILDSDHALEKLNERRDTLKRNWKRKARTES